MGRRRTVEGRNKKGQSTCGGRLPGCASIVASRKRVPFGWMAGEATRWKRRRRGEGMLRGSHPEQVCSASDSRYLEGSAGGGSPSMPSGPLLSAKLPQGTVPQAGGLLARGPPPPIRWPRCGRLRTPHSPRTGSDAPSSWDPAWPVVTSRCQPSSRSYPQWLGAMDPSACAYSRILPRGL